MTGSVTPSEKEAILNRLGRALGHANHVNDIYSCSWSPLTQFQDTVGHMKEADRAALRNSTTNVRPIITEQNIVLYYVVLFNT